MYNTELSKQWILELFIQLISQQEIRDSKFTVRFGEEMQKASIWAGDEDRP